uniref:Platelet-derived growth factor (PDGF) family profile domain-containing protein n=1 Tax=Hippocampus comes TaxID=109280 RepID=A0A3Q3DDM3_HIPCM
PQRNARIWNICSPVKTPKLPQPRLEKPVAAMEGHAQNLSSSQAPVSSDQQVSLQSVASVDQLLQLLYPEYDLLQQCLRKKAWHASSASPPLQSDWAQLREEALYKIQRTSCQPREVCVEVTKEYPESTSQFYLPRCVALHRCGGCCTNEAFYCANTSHVTPLSSQLMELSPPRMERSVVMVTFVNHTGCECLPKRPLHSIIRRRWSLTLVKRNESAGLLRAAQGRILRRRFSNLFLSFSSLRLPEALDSGLLALCGPNRVLKEPSCECVCRNGLTEASCGPGWKLDHNTCECQCQGQGEGKWCPIGQRWDDELCGCVCAARCPGNQPLNPDTCLCQCRESPQSCLRQGKRFNPNTCSCYRLPCRTPKRACLTGFYYSHQVCQCIPNYMKPAWN